MISMSDAMVETLKALGIRYVFGVSGANIEHLHDAIERRGNGEITALLATSETGAAFMADGLARRDNCLAVCCSTSGGGMMNLATGIAESFADRVPVLAIIGQAPDTLAGHGAFQDSSGVSDTVNAAALFGAISRFTACLNNPATFWSIFTRALQAAITYPSGPAVLLVPRNYWDMAVSANETQLLSAISSIIATIEVATASLQLVACGDTDELLDDALRSAATLIQQANYPLAIVGPHIRWQEAAQLDQRLAALSVPTATTLASVSHVAATRANYLGIVGTVGHPSVHHYMETKCDLVLLIGTAMEVTHRAPIEAKLMTLPLLLFHVERPRLPNHARICNRRPFNGAECVLLLEQLQAAGVSKASSLRGYHQTWIKAELADQDHALVTDGQSQLLQQSTALQELQPYLGACDALFLDAGNCAAAAAHYLRVPAGVKTLIALGMGGMGYAAAAAIGAKKPHGADPRSTLVLSGDGAFLMTGLELHTAIEHDLAILFVFFNNSRHGMCVTRQKRFFGGRVTAALLAPFDIAKTVAGLSRDKPCWTASVRTVAELRAALALYFDQHRQHPGVIDVITDQEEIPPFFPLYENYQEVTSPFVA